MATADKGNVIKVITDDLKSLGYDVDYKILNALNFGLPQKRERTIIVGIRKGLDNFEWPNANIKMLPLSKILEKKPDKKHYASDKIKAKRLSAHTPKVTPSIWHENKSGNISSYPYSCALRAGASYNYLLVDGIRRITPRETLRLQGYPDSYKMISSDSQVKKQTGNSVPVPMVQAVIKEVLNAIQKNKATRKCPKAA